MWNLRVSKLQSNNYCLLSLCIVLRCIIFRCCCCFFTWFYYNIHVLYIIACRCYNYYDGQINIPFEGQCQIPTFHSIMWICFFSLSLSHKPTHTHTNKNVYLYHFIYDWTNIQWTKCRKQMVFMVTQQHETTMTSTTISTNKKTWSIEFDCMCTLSKILAVLRKLYMYIVLVSGSDSIIIRVNVYLFLYLFFAIDWEFNYNGGQ